MRSVGQLNIFRMLTGTLTRTGRFLSRFLYMAHLLMAFPEMIVFLHWLFGWFPMKLWVMIALGVYSLLMLIISLVAAKNNV